MALYFLDIDSLCFDIFQGYLVDMKYFFYGK